MQITKVGALVIALQLMGLGGSGLLAADTQSTAGKHWQLFRGDPAARGIAQTTLPAKPQLLWKHRVPKGAFEATAAIVDGVVYIGDLDGTLFAFKLRTGEVLWEKKIDTGYVAAPAVRDGMVYLGDIDGVFRCFDAVHSRPLILLSQSK